MRPRWRREEVWLVAWFGTLVALAMGVTNGEGSHRQVLLYGLRMVEPDFLPGDWFTWHTRHYHLLFGWLTAALTRAGVLEVGLALGNVAAAYVFAAASYAAARAVYRRPALGWAAGVVLATAVRTDSLAFGDILTPRFELRTVAAVATTVALAALATGWYGAAGLAFGVAGLAHGQFAVLLVPVVAGTALFVGRRAGRAAVARLVVPAGLLAAHNLVRALHYADAPGVDQAYALYMRVCYPAHYLPATWGIAPFAAFAGALALGVGGILLRRPRRNAGLEAALGLMALLVAGSLALGYGVVVETANRLWAWRLAAFLTLASYVAAGMALAARPSRAATGWRAVAGWSLLVAGLCLFTRFAPFRGRWLAGPMVALLPAVVLGARWLRRQPLWRRVAGFLPLVLLSAAMGPAVWGGVRASHVRLRPSDATRAPLYAWSRAETPPASVFVVPPDWGAEFRLLARRPIVADWRTTPLYAPDILEWARRLDDLSGGSRPATLAEALAGYARLDCPGLERLRSRYGATHVVRPAAAAPLACGREMYRDGHWTVLALEPWSGQARAAPRPRPGAARA